MKTKILFLIIIRMLILENVFAQHIDIIGSRGENLISKNGNIFIKEGVTSTVQIDSVNRLLFEITVNSQPIGYEYKVDTIFNVPELLSNVSVVDSLLKSILVNTGGKQAIAGDNKINPLLFGDLEALLKSYYYISRIENKENFDCELTQVDLLYREIRENFDRYYDYYINQKIDSSLKQYFISKHNYLVKVDSISKLLNDKLFQCNYPICVAQGDEIDINVQIKRKTDSKDVKSYSYSAYVYGGFKINFNAGFVFDFFSIDRKYSFKPVDSQSVSLIKDKNKFPCTPSIAIFTNAYFSQKGMVNYGLSLGLGVDQNSNSNYYVGPSLIIGREQRLVIALGLSVSQKDVLKSRYSVGEIFLNDTKPDSEDLVEKSWIPGLFFLIGFNLNTIKKQVTPN
ncbi:MAG: hypothetical protein AB7S54_06610 [Bacteroidales bacterium]